MEMMDVWVVEIARINERPSDVAHKFMHKDLSKRSHEMYLKRQQKAVKNHGRNPTTKSGFAVYGVFYHMVS